MSTITNMYTILAAAVNIVGIEENAELSVTDMHSSVKYSSISSFLCQCERIKPLLHVGGGNSNKVNLAHVMGGGRGNGNGVGSSRNRFKPHRTTDDVAEMKKKIPCHT